MTSERQAYDAVAAVAKRFLQSSQFKHIEWADTAPPLAHLQTPAMLYNTWQSSVDACTERLAGAIKARNVDPILQKKVVDNFAVHATAYHERFFTVLKGLFFKLSGDPGGFDPDTILPSIRARYEEVLTAVIDLQLRRIDCSYTVQHSQAAIGASHKRSLASKSEQPGSRGHPPQAVAILERAYQHTKNISQSEKKRLAEITGLQPRQIIIWFQNRRNRKSVKNKQKQDDSAASLADPTCTLKSRGHRADGAARRKTATPPTALRSYRHFTPGTPPPQIDRRSFFRQTNSSVEAEQHAAATIPSETEFSSQYPTQGDFPQFQVGVLSESDWASLIVEQARTADGRLQEDRSFEHHHSATGQTPLSDLEPTSNEALMDLYFDSEALSLQSASNDALPIRANVTSEQSPQVVAYGRSEPQRGDQHGCVNSEDHHFSQQLRGVDASPAPHIRLVSIIEAKKVALASSSEANSYDLLSRAVVESLSTVRLPRPEHAYGDSPFAFSSTALGLRTAFERTLHSYDAVDAGRSLQTGDYIELTDADMTAASLMTERTGVMLLSSTQGFPIYDSLLASGPEGELEDSGPEDVSTPTQHKDSALFPEKVGSTEDSWIESFADSEETTRTPTQCSP
ncbi:unnamed protein product [Parajaminaea phylloscopi]